MNTAEPAVELSDYEKERGKPISGLYHGVVQVRLGACLSAQAGDRYLVASELTLGFPDGCALTPDLSILPKRSINWRHEQIPYRQSTLTTIDIPSPREGHQRILDNMDVYFTHGVETAWIVDIACGSSPFIGPVPLRPWSATGAKSPTPPPA